MTMKRGDTVTSAIASGLTIVSVDPFEPPAPADDQQALIVVVMDPLAAPLSCPCVKGYAQRDYKKLAAHFERELDRQQSSNHLGEGPRVLARRRVHEDGRTTAARAEGHRDQE